ncbi:hypothetical protein NLI96_g6706 [Meripilus lineatus]|uniref:Uncharacterized protein n=1 Tax=Meripilus lineatus TaxID=2056292 RepID=A0AAD5V0J5_9APHY|nr:hypothetical protein NLI96_g6706 [Physisporinus lineatus]
MRLSSALAFVALATAAAPALSAPYPYDASDLFSKREYEDLMTREEAVELVARVLLSRNYVAEARDLLARASGRGSSPPRSMHRPRAYPTPAAVVDPRDLEARGHGKPGATTRGPPKPVATTKAPPPNASTRKPKPRSLPTLVLEARDLERRASITMRTTSPRPKPRSFPTLAPVVAPGI